MKSCENCKCEYMLIERACEWLRNNWRKYINIDADGIVCFGHWENDFRKAMKGDLDYDKRRTNKEGSI